MDGQGSGQRAPHPPKHPSLSRAGHSQGSSLRPAPQLELRTRTRALWAGGLQLERAAGGRAHRPRAQLVTGRAWPGLPLPCSHGPSLHRTSPPNTPAAAFLMTPACVVLMTPDPAARGRARPVQKEECWNLGAEVVGLVPHPPKPTRAPAFPWHLPCARPWASGSAHSSRTLGKAAWGLRHPPRSPGTGKRRLRSRHSPKGYMAANAKLGFKTSSL